MSLIPPRRRALLAALVGAMAVAAVLLRVVEFPPPSCTGLVSHGTLVASYCVHWDWSLARYAAAGPTPPGVAAISFTEPPWPFLVTLSLLVPVFAIVASVTYAVLTALRWLARKR